uniref:BZIP domain-containing protein n=1 Tax=Strigamia maritima TaxID=126957 RepID=T1JP06_STRMM
MDSIHQFSLFSDDWEENTMDALDLGLFPELQPLSEEEQFIDETKVGMLADKFMPESYPSVSPNNSFMLNNSHVQASQSTTGKPRIVKILIAKEMKKAISKPSGNPSSTSTDDKGGLSKNAIAARENRIKKKKYVEEIEKSAQLMSSEIQVLKKRTKEYIEVIKTLKTENRYLRNVLANDKEISALLKTIKKTPGIIFGGSSITKRHRSSAGDDSFNEAHVSTPRKKRRSDDSLSSVISSEDDGFASDEPVGVCLHVASGTLSIEFCSTCSSRASSESLEP